MAPDALETLPAIIAALPERAVFTEHMRTLRAESLYAYRSAGETAAQQIIDIHTATGQ